MKSGHGSFKWMRTRPGSTTWTSRTRSLKAFTPAPRYRSSENLTSSAVTGSPLWNFAPLRRTNSQARPSLETVHDSARLGARGTPGIGFTMASCSAYMIMNGVMIPGVSAGSNQVGASEMWTPQVIRPSGAARDDVGVSHTTLSRSVRTLAYTGLPSNRDRLIVIPSRRRESGNRPDGKPRRPECGVIIGEPTGLSTGPRCQDHARYGRVRAVTHRAGCTLVPPRP